MAALAATLGEVSTGEVVEAVALVRVLVRAFLLLAGVAALRVDGRRFLRATAAAGWLAVLVPSSSLLTEAAVSDASRVVSWPLPLDSTAADCEAALPTPRGDRATGVLTAGGSLAAGAGDEDGAVGGSSTAGVESDDGGSTTRRRLAECAPASLSSSPFSLASALVSALSSSASSSSLSSPSPLSLGSEVSSRARSLIEEG